MDYVLKMTSELSLEDVQDILYVLNETYGDWGSEEYFSWKYQQNPYGESLHVICYDQNKPISNESFWRNDLGDLQAFQSCDTAVLPEYQGRGVFRHSVFAGINRLVGEYLYGFPNETSLPGFLRFGWNLKRFMKLGVNFPGKLLTWYDTSDPIPDVYVKWRFLDNPKKSYYCYEWKGRYFLLSGIRARQFLVIGEITYGFALRAVNPRVLCSFDASDALFNFPRKQGYVIDNTSYVINDRFIPSYRDDTL